MGCSWGVSYIGDIGDIGQGVTRGAAAAAVVAAVGGVRVGVGDGRQGSCSVLLYTHTHSTFQTRHEAARLRGSLLASLLLLQFTIHNNLQFIHNFNPSSFFSSDRAFHPNRPSSRSSPSLADPLPASPSARPPAARYQSQSERSRSHNAVPPTAASSASSAHTRPDPRPRIYTWLAAQFIRHSFAILHIDITSTSTLCSHPPICTT